MKDLNGTASAKRAGYAERGAHVTASRLLRNPKVLARVKQLQAEAAERNRITFDKILGKLEKVYERALEQGQLAAANRAAELQAKLAGLFIDKAETRLHATFAPTSPDELDAEIARLAKLAGYSKTKNEH